MEPTTQDISNIEQRLKQTSIPDPEKNLLNALLALEKQNQGPDPGADVDWIYVWGPPI